jgi:AraC-like DNA-binding protein
MNFLKYSIGCNMLWSLSTDIVESSDWHDHDMFQFVLCRGKKGHMLTDAGEIPFSSARTIFIPPGVLHRFIVEPGQVGRLRLVCFPSEELPRFLSPLHITMLDGLARIGVSSADHQGQEHWLEHLSDSITEGFGIDDIWVQRMQWGAIGLLLTLHAKEQHVADGLPYLRHKGKIREIVSWIEGNLSENITLEQISDDFGISRSLLTREFRSYTGKSFVEYCNARRTQKAAIALATTENSVTSVALDSGFSNLSHFHRQFKSQFGITPAVFRRKIVEEGRI